jgi:hypothetical protein
MSKIAYMIVWSNGFYQTRTKALGIIAKTVITVWDSRENSNDLLTG